MLKVVPVFGLCAHIAVQLIFSKPRAVELYVCKILLFNNENNIKLNSICISLCMHNLKIIWRQPFLVPTVLWTPMPRNDCPA